jgi:hypothetical protein
VLLPFGPDTVQRALPRRTHPKLVGMIPKPGRHVNQVLRQEIYEPISREVIHGPGLFLGWQIGVLEDQALDQHTEKNDDQDDACADDQAFSIS